VQFIAMIASDRLKQARMRISSLQMKISI
jgi:hypothetical protein